MTDPTRQERRDAPELSPDLSDGDDHYLEPGRFELLVVVTDVGSARLGSHDLVAGAEYELGTLNLERPIEFALDWTGKRPTPDEPWSIRALLPYTALPARTVMVLEEPALKLSLLPSDYRLGLSAGEDLGTGFEIDESTAGGTLAVK